MVSYVPVAFVPVALTAGFSAFSGAGCVAGAAVGCLAGLSAGFAVAAGGVGVAAVFADESEDVTSAETAGVSWGCCEVISGAVLSSG